MKNIFERLLSRVNTIQFKYLNEQITSEEKKEKIDTAIKMLEIDIDTMSKENKTFIIETLEQYFTKDQTRELKKLLHDYYIVERKSSR